MKKQECVYREVIEKIDDKQDSIAEDIAIIKSYLVGNGREGIIKKTDRHEKYFNMIAGGSALIGFALAIAKVIK